MSEHNETGLRFHLYAQKGDGRTITVDLSEDDLLNAAAGSPRFRSRLKSVVRLLPTDDPQVYWLSGHLNRMDAIDDEKAPASNEPGVSELIEMLKLQTKVNESYARLAILLGEMYVGKAER